MFIVSAPAALVLMAIALTGCASHGPEPEVHGSAEAKAAADCVKSTGTNICRPAAKGAIDVVNSISADDLRKSGGPITGARPGTTGN
jgi:hypothetical protein